MDLEVPPTISRGENSLVTFKDLGLASVLEKAYRHVGWKTPTHIQEEVIPLVLQGKDVIGLARRGCGKTGAFGLLLLQHFLDVNPQGLFGLVLAPGKSARRIGRQIGELGSGVGVKCAVFADRINATSHSNSLAGEAHIVIATPGCLVNRLENTTRISLLDLKFLIVDDADGMLDAECEHVEKILSMIPSERRTLLFSTTMTSRVEKLRQTAFLVDPVQIQVNFKFVKRSNFFQGYVFKPPHEVKDVQLVHLLNEAAGHSVIVFCATWNEAWRICILLRHLGITAFPLHDRMSRDNRLVALDLFKAANGQVLIATDAASRGLKVPDVDWVINYNLPDGLKEYTFRIAHAARPRRDGKAITLVDQNDFMRFQFLMDDMEKNLPRYPMEKFDAVDLQARVAEAEKLTLMDLQLLKAETSGTFISVF